MIECCGVEAGGDIWKEWPIARSCSASEGERILGSVQWRLSEGLLYEGLEVIEDS